MRLSDFILRDMESILAQWEAFAATRLPAAASMASLELRDHAQQILEAIAADLSTPQSRDEQAAKSMGLTPAAFPARETAAQTHAVLRQKSGYDMKQLASEYRALRASVLSLWMDACLPAAPPAQDVIRFNEAIDQALAESIGHFSARVDQARNLLLGMLSHDMRSPLQTVQMTAQYLGQLNVGPDVSAAAARLICSGANLQGLLDDLVDFNRTNLGLGISIVPSRVDLGAICAQELEPLRFAYPNSVLELNGRETGTAGAAESRRECNPSRCTERAGPRRRLSPDGQKQRIEASHLVASADAPISCFPYCAHDRYIGSLSALRLTHSLRRTKATLIYRRTRNLRAVQLLPGHTKLESTVRYRGIEVDDAQEIAEQTEV